MSAGLQLWDAQGRTLLDASTRAGRAFGAVAIVPVDSEEAKAARWVAGNPGRIDVNLSGGTPFWAFTPRWLFQHVSQNSPVPIVSIDANGISWRYSYHDGNFWKPMPGTLVYGVY